MDEGHRPEKPKGGGGTRDQLGVGGGRQDKGESRSTME